MGIRTGSEYVESLRDDRTIYVNGERVRDVTNMRRFVASLRRSRRSTTCSISAARN